MRVDIVSFLKILKYGLEVGIVSLGCHFLSSSARSHKWIGCHKKFQFCIREHCRADVATVHDHSLLGAEFAEFSVNEIPDLRHGSDRTNLVCYGH